LRLGLVGLKLGLVGLKLIEWKANPKASEAIFGANAEMASVFADDAGGIIETEAQA